MTFQEQLLNSARDTFCGVAKVNQWLLRQLVNTGRGQIFQPGLAVQNWILSNHCDLPPEPPPDPPFTGGQCPVEYLVEVDTVLVLKNGDVEPGSLQRLGAIVNGKVFGFVTRLDTSGTGTIYLELRHGTLLDPNALAVTPFRSASYTFYDDIRFSNIVVTRRDGLPDECGDPAYLPPPLSPDERTFNVDIDYTFSDGTDLTIPVVLFFNDFNLDANLHINVPVTFKIDPNFTLSPTFNFDFSGTWNLNNNTFNVNLPGPPGVPPPSIPFNPPPSNVYPPPTAGPPPINPPDTPEPPPEEPVDEQQFESVIVAALVTVSEIDTPNRITTIFQDGNPDILAPSAGFISFYVNTGNGYGWTQDIPVKNRRNVIECPWPRGASSVKGTPNQGIELTVTPIYKPIAVKVQ